MSYKSKDVTPEEINTWKKNKKINPRTNRQISENSKIYKYLEEMEQKLKNKKNQLKVKTNKKHEVTILNEKLVELEIKNNSLNDEIIDLKSNESNLISSNDELKEKLKICEKKLNNLKNINSDLNDELKEKNKLLEKNQEEIAKLINELKEVSEKKTESLDKEIQTKHSSDNEEHGNNLVLVIPIAILCLGWAIKNVVFGLSG